MDRDQLGKSNHICWRLFGYIYITIKGNLLNSHSIELVEIGIDRDQLGQSHAICWVLFGFIYAPIKGNFLKSYLIDLIQIGMWETGFRSHMQCVGSCLVLFVPLYNPTWSILCQLTYLKLEWMGTELGHYMQSVGGCLGLFVSIKGNLLPSHSIDMVQIGIDGDWPGQSHAMCWELFVFICASMKGNLLNSHSIDLEWIETNLGSYM
jgi:hypothetical protein